MPKEKDDLVPYYRPGTTEPEMVPRSSVPGYAPEAELSAEDEKLVAEDKAESAAPKSSAKKAAKKR